MLPRMFWIKCGKLTLGSKGGQISQQGISELPMVNIHDLMDLAMMVKMPLLNLVVKTMIIGVITPKIPVDISLGIIVWI